MNEDKQKSFSLLIYTVRNIPCGLSQQNGHTAAERGEGRGGGRKEERGGREGEERGERGEGEEERGERREGKGKGGRQ